MKKSSEPLWLVSFYDATKHVIDHMFVRGTRNEARALAAKTYLKKADMALYAGFIVTHEKHGGY